MIRLQELMSREVESVSPQTTAEAAMNRMRTKGVRHLVVMQDGRVMGVVSDRDLGGKRGPGARANEPVSESMSAHTVTGKPDMTIRQAANLMRGHVVGCLPVLDNGKLKGIVTVSDLLDAIGRGLERPTTTTERARLSRRHGRKAKGRG